MSEQPEALRLADALTEEHPFPRDIRLAAAELRRQHEEITELRHGAGVANQTIAGLVAQRDALLGALEEIHQATMKNKVVIAKYVGINFLAAIAIRKAKEGG